MTGTDRTPSPPDIRDREEKELVRQRVWSELMRVARPDSRFHWNFSEFIPDFEGSDRCAQAVRDLPEYRRARVVFVTPDNGLTLIRQLCMEDGKDLLVSTYGIERGFLFVPTGSVEPSRVPYAATLDGLDYVGHPVSLRELASGPRLDLLLTGAAAISTGGLRFGKGHGYFDLEWGMFREVGLVADDTPVVAIVHDCQVVDVDVQPRPFDTVVDVIVTPTRVLRPPLTHEKPSGINWELLEPGMVERIPPLRELTELRAPKR
ncbi:MAG TPA: 5-formyltetrahydrofolate cyclo-ligase [Actinomycetota bacterium]|nr:5-formyltetrahydrofolate cyclo-ligase [Actinomycetota bacterium]